MWDANGENIVDDIAAFRSANERFEVDGARMLRASSCVTMESGSTTSTRSGRQSRCTVVAEDERARDDVAN